MAAKTGVKNPKSASSETKKPRKVREAKKKAPAATVTATQSFSGTFTVSEIMEAKRVRAEGIKAYQAYLSMASKLVAQAYVNGDIGYLRTLNPEGRLTEWIEQVIKEVETTPGMSAQRLVGRMGLKQSIIHTICDYLVEQGYIKVCYRFFGQTFRQYIAPDYKPKIPYVEEF